MQRLNPLTRNLMKKHIIFLLAVVAVMLTACPPNPPVPPPDPDPDPDTIQTDTTDTVIAEPVSMYLVDAVYLDSEDGTHDNINYIFGTGNVAFDGTNFSGTGDCLSVATCVDRSTVNANHYPQPDTYTIDYMLSQPHTMTVARMKVTNGTADRPTPMTSGTMTMSGTELSTLFELSLTDNQGEYEYVCTTPVHIRYTGTEPDDPDDPDNPDTTTVLQANLIEATCYGDRFVANTNEVDFAFTTDNLVLDANGYPSGTGYYIAVVSFATSLNQNLFPNAGTYNMSTTATAMTIQPGVTDGQYYDGCRLVHVTNGTLDGDWTLFNVGQMVIAGDENSATFDLDFTADDNTRYQFHCVQSNITVADQRQSSGGGGGGSAVEFQYEPTTPTTINLTASSATINTTANGYFFLDMPNSDGSGYTLMAACFNQSNGSTWGTFTVSGDGSAATILASDGVSGGQISYSFYASVSGSQISVANGIYFLAGGSLNISQNSITGTLTTYYGSTINVSYSGTVSVTSSASRRNTRSSLTRSPKTAFAQARRVRR